MKTRLLFFSIYILCHFAIAEAADGDYKRGVAAYNNAEYLSAYKLLLPEAEQGNTNAQFRVGYLLLNGMGIESNTKQGLGWLKKSAESGDFTAQSYLGDVYSEGNAVEKNLVEAYAWKDISNRNHQHRITESELDVIKSEMTPVQIKNAKVLANSYFEKYVKPFAQ